MDHDSQVREVPESSVGSEAGRSRRGLLGKGIKLAAAIPAVLAATQGGIAYADRGRPKWAGDDPGHGRGPGNGNAFGRGPLFNRPFYALELCRVGEVGSSDFAPSGSSPGSDPLAAGAMRVFEAENTSSPASRVWVRLAGAAASTPYTVAFVRFNDHAREPLGTITTGPNGNFAGFTPGTLSGTHRVGVFVLVNNNNGSDQFVSCVP